MKKFALLVLLFVAANSCNVIDQSPVDRIDLDTFYTGVSDTESGLIGIYNQVFRDLYGDFLFLNNKSSGDLTAPVDGPQGDAGIYRPNLSLFNDAGAGAMWERSYKAIAFINLLLEKVPSINGGLFEEIPEEDLTRQDVILGEARFMRAFIYYHLVQYFGDVPLMLQFPTSSDPASNFVARTPAETVWNQIIEDVEFAEENLPWNHNYLTDDGAGQIVQSKGRANRGAAKILRARIHLMRREWQQAIEKADEVINSGEFTLARRWVTIFESSLGQNSPESILEIQTDPESPTQFDNTGGYAWFHQDGRPRRGATIEAYELFEGDEDNPVDVRKAFSMFRSEENPGDIYALKYSNAYPWWEPANPFNFIPFRLAECYLIKAEALNELDPLNSEVFTLINAIRARSQDLDFPEGPVPGIQPLKSADFSTQEQLREAIREERRRELMFEGHRFFDLLRYDSYDGGKRALFATYLMQYSYEQNGNTVTGRTCPEGVTCTEVEVGDPGKLLLPIPVDEVRINTLLEQNNAYK